MPETVQLARYCPPFPNNGWLMAEERLDGWAFHQPAGGGIRVIFSGEVHRGQRWIHCSLSRASRLPTYQDVQLVRLAFMTPHRQSIMVWPSVQSRRYVNLHPYCLHLYACEEDCGDGLPDFTGGTGMI